MNLGVWAAIAGFFLKLWSVFRGGQGTRITVEARPEAAIEKEKVELDRLRKELRKKRNELNKKTLEDCTARENKLFHYANTILLPKLKQLQQEHRELRQRYLAAGGLPFDDW